MSMDNGFTFNHNLQFSRNDTDVDQYCWQLVLSDVCKNLGEKIGAMLTCNVFPLCVRLRMPVIYTAAVNLSLCKSKSKCLYLYRVLTTGIFPSQCADQCIVITRDIKQM